MFILFSCQFDQKFTSKTVFTSYYFKLSLPVFLKCFITFAQLQPHVSVGKPQES